MDREMAMVKEFHKARGIQDGVLLGNGKIGTVGWIRATLQTVHASGESMAAFLKQEGLLALKSHGDPRLLRVHLILEEAFELVEALANCDEDKAADALADLSYVTNGTALTFGIPLKDVFDEVHAANMRKRASKNDPRAQDKGASWTPPDVGAAIERGRARLEASGLLR